MIASYRGSITTYAATNNALKRRQNIENTEFFAAICKNSARTGNIYSTKCNLHSCTWLSFAGPVTFIYIHIRIYS